MKIAFLTQYYSPNMGYTENILPIELAKLGHDVHVITSEYQIQGDTPSYINNYYSFLGPPKMPTGTTQTKGFTLHRLKSFRISRYNGLKGLKSTLKKINPDIAQFACAADIISFQCLLSIFSAPWHSFTECHQHASIAFPLNTSSKSKRKKIINILYTLTRTYPSKWAHRRVQKCFAIAPDCARIAKTHYGVPEEKLVHLPLGTDTDTFHPCKTTQEEIRRNIRRKEWGANESDIVSIYTGRFSTSKNPLLLAQAIDTLNRNGQAYKGIFVGSGEQKSQIENCMGCKTIGFVKHNELAELYQAADIGVWPEQESMSMLDASSSGLPIIVNDAMGELDRISGNGLAFKANDKTSLSHALLSLSNKALRIEMGEKGRYKMQTDFSWRKHAKAREYYYRSALSQKSKNSI